MSDKYYAIIDEYVDEPQEDGTIRQRLANPVFRDGLCVLNRPAEISGGILVRREQCVVLRPDAYGLYVIREVDGNLSEKQKAMEGHMARHPNIIGPFNRREDALCERERLRPKTAMERAMEEIASLKAEIEAAKSHKKDKE